MTCIDISPEIHKEPWAYENMSDSTDHQGNADQSTCIFMKMAIIEKQTIIKDKTGKDVKKLEAL